jgi:peptidoglycan DL-endopeptidase LytF
VSRKDTMIVAVLINAGLLVVLFASALKSGGSDTALVANQEPLVEEVPVLAAKKEVPVVVGDEVDRALQQFAAQQTASLPTAAPVDSNAFVEDLKAIATPEHSLTATPQNPTVQTLVAPLVKEQKMFPEFTQVTVKKGDVLEKIARHNHSNVADIMKANNLTNSNLRIGQVLKIPHKTGNKIESPALPASNASEGQSKLYTVKKGDSPWTIAVKNQMKVEDLLKLNNLSEAQAKRLKPGDKLRIQ